MESEEDEQSLVAGGGPGVLLSFPGLCPLLHPLLYFLFVLHSPQPEQSTSLWHSRGALMTTVVAKN